MDEKFQDRIDNYLLNRMNDVEKKEFLREVEQEEEKKNQLEFTQNVKDSIRSREEKLRALKQFQRQYEHERRIAAYRATGTERAACCRPAPKAETRPVQPRKKIWLWISGVAAVFVVGFVAVETMLMNESSPNYNCSPMENVRGENGVFGASLTDSTDNDTVNLIIEKDVLPDE